VAAFVRAYGPPSAHCCTADQLIALAMGTDPRTSPIQTCKLSVVLTFKVTKDS